LDSNLLTLRIHLKISDVTIIVRKPPDIQLIHRDRLTGSYPLVVRYFGLSLHLDYTLKGPLP
jgi:hypothetical protein